MTKLKHQMRKMAETSVVAEFISAWGREAGDKPRPYGSGIVSNPKHQLPSTRSRQAYTISNDKAQRPNKKKMVSAVEFS